jgi:23S rRNA (cytidine1920-2'-O)/16S rRNA (cytidine1409-2'-O)-methyltransferase
VLPAILRLVAAAADVIALVKPQFEVGKGKVGKGGIVRDEALRREALDGILKFASGIGLNIIGVIESPIKGASGNQEFLAAFHHSNRA